jgi:glycosyltransferase involved in cell wall biosynthesis
VVAFDRVDIVVTVRIALISSLLLPDTRGGAEAYVEHAARTLGERNDVVVLTGSAAKADGVPTIRLPSLPVLDRSKPPGIRVLWHALDQWLPSVHTAVSRELKRFGPDVVVTHHPQGLSAAVFTGIAVRRLPHVHTAHDLNLLCARTTMTKEGEFCGGRCAGCRVQRVVRSTTIKLDLARLIGVSRYICDRHVRAKIVPAERAIALRLGALPGPSRQRQVGDVVTLGFIGTLAPHKGVRTLLAAFREAPGSWRLVVAGSGPLTEAVRAAARADDRIDYVGHVDGPAKDAFFDRCDLLVIPSEWEEPATFVAVEAAVRGIPTVVSARGGLIEAPEARTFRSGAPGELLEAVRWYVERPARVEEASARLLESRVEYEWSTHVQRVEALLEEVRDEHVAHRRKT